MQAVKEKMSSIPLKHINDLGLNKRKIVNPIEK